MPFDHNGAYYDSINEMAKRYDLNPSTLRYRMKEWTKKGISLACILTMPSDRQSLRNYNLKANSKCSDEKILSIMDSSKRTRCTECQDHLGQEFASLTEMCDHWGISYQIYSSRIHRNGWTIEKALTTPISINANQPIVDPNGVWWESISKMCKAWHINEKTFKNRMKTGNYDLYTALTAEPTNAGGRKKTSA